MSTKETEGVEQPPGNRPAKQIIPSIQSPLNLGGDVDVGDRGGTFRNIIITKPFIKPKPILALHKKCIIA